MILQEIERLSQGLPKFADAMSRPLPAPITNACLIG